MSDFKPMLAVAAPADLAQLSFPLLASPKLDGIRCVMRGGKALSRKLKPIPNDFVRSFLEAHAPDGCDGELLLADPTAPFNEVSSAIMAKAGEPNFTYAVFDSTIHAGGFETRLKAIAHEIEKWQAVSPTPDRIQVIFHAQCETLDELLKLHAIHVQERFEGTMVRKLSGPYKHGRSTEREGYLLKVKDFVDEEAVVLKVHPLMKNNNPKETDALGHAKRATNQEFLVAMDQMGSLDVRTDDGAEFNLGGGFSLEQRVKLWQCRDLLPGMRLKFKHQAPPGGRPKGVAPRFPVFLGWRDTEID